MPQRRARLALNERKLLSLDGLYLRNAGIPTYGVSGIFFDLDDIRAHGRDERIGVKQFFAGQEFLYRLVTALASPPVQKGIEK